MKNEKSFVCVICQDEFAGFGNNPAPAINVKTGEERCCDECNARIVIPRRIILAMNR